MKKWKILRFQSPQWGSNSKDKLDHIDGQCYGFQSPQWGSNSKERREAAVIAGLEFQSPQWGSNSKVKYPKMGNHEFMRFSPRNGEVILKPPVGFEEHTASGFSPRNGEVILK